MRTFVPAVAVVAALIWPAAASGQSLAEAAQREAARRKAEASAPKTPAGNPSPAAAALAGQQVEPDSGASASESSGTISLAEVARREAARRKALAEAGKRAKLLTNQDVKKWVPPEEAAPTDASASAKASGKPADQASEATAAEKPGAEKTAADATKGEQYWRDRMTAAREELRRNQAFAEALQSRINALSAEFSAKDDPYQRAQVADDRQKALAELDRLNTDIDNNKKAIADLEDEARRAGIPAGWVR